MDLNNITIAGGTGFLGKLLETYFTNQGKKVTILTRSPKRENEVLWDAKTLGKWTKIIDSCDVLINLTGRSVDCRYTDKNKALILNSRVDSTKILGEAVTQSTQPPKVWMNASTATLYQYSYDTPNTEDNTNYNENDFSTNVGLAWEDTFYSFNTPKTRKIALRTSIVFGKEGGAFTPLKMLTKFGLGGKQGNGKQMVSWMHEKDYARAVDFILQTESIKGAVNFCAPQPVSNSVLMKALRKAMKMPFGIPHPEFLLEIGARIIQTETELILKSRNVLPKRLLDAGFQFDFPDIQSAVTDLIRN